MHNALELCFDSRTEDTVTGLFHLLREAKLSSTMLDLDMTPHVSLGVYDKLLAGNWRTRADSFFSEEPALDITFSSVGSFAGDEGVVFIAPVVSRPLLDAHERYHRTFSDLSSSMRPYYLPGAWVPHCTVGFGLPPAMLGEAMCLVRESVLPLSGRIERVDLVQFDPGSGNSIETTASWALNART